MVRSIAFLLLCLLIGSCTKEEKLQTESIQVKTIVCGSCKKTVEQAVYAVEGVKSVDVNLDAKIMAVKFNPEQTNLQTIEMAITDAGYSANDRQRDPAAFEKLDACCKTD